MFKNLSISKRLRKLSLPMGMMIMLAFFVFNVSAIETIRHSGAVYPSDPLDIYTFEATAGEIIRATLTCQESDGFSLDPLLIIFGPNGFFIFDDDGYTPCAAYASSIISFTVPTTGIYTVYVTGASGLGGFYRLTIKNPGSQDPAFTDGRINNYDTAAPVAVYMVNDEMHIYSADGNLLLVVSAAQISGTPDNPDSNMLIASGNDVSLYRITGEGRGLWQINAPQYNGKTYVLIFSELYPDAGYTSYEIE